MKRRVFVLVLMVVSMAFGTTRAGGLGAKGEPTIDLSVGAASSGQEVEVTGSDWPATTALTIMVCGDGATDGTDGTEACDVLGGRTVVTDPTGGFQTPLVVRIPPAPCPCAVWSFSASTDNQVTTTIAIVGAPFAPPSTEALDTGPSTEDPVDAETSTLPKDSSSDSLAWLLAVGASVAIVVLVTAARRIAHRAVESRRARPDLDRPAIGPGARALGPGPRAIGPGTRDVPVTTLEQATDAPVGASPGLSATAPSAFAPGERSEATGTVPVVFTLPDKAEARAVALSGDFNGWAHDATPLHRCGDRWTVTLALEPGCSYRYQFLVDGQWESNGPADSSTMPNPFEAWYSIVTVGPREAASCRPIA